MKQNDLSTTVKSKHSCGIQLQSLKPMKKRSPSDNRSSHLGSSDLPNERGIQWPYAPPSEVQYHPLFLSLWLPLNLIRIRSSISSPKVAHLYVSRQPPHHPLAFFTEPIIYQVLDKHLLNDLKEHCRKDLGTGGKGWSNNPLGPPRPTAKHTTADLWGWGAST